MYYPIFDFSQLLHGFASNVVWMLFGWTPTKIVKIGVLPLYVIELWVIFAILNQFFYKSTDQKSFIFALESPQGT